MVGDFWAGQIVQDLYVLNRDFEGGTLLWESKRVDLGALANEMRPLTIRGVHIASPDRRDRAKVSRRTWTPLLQI